MSGKHKTIEDLYKIDGKAELLSEDVVRVYRADAPETPTIYRRGQMAEAEPVLPEWQMPVDALFE